MSNKRLWIVYSYSVKRFAGLVTINGLMLQKQKLQSILYFKKPSAHLVEKHSKRISVLQNLCAKKELLGFRADLRR